MSNIISMLVKVGGDVRVWFRADDDQMRPGKAGLAFRLEKLPAVIRALTDLEAEARRSGLID